MSSEYKKDLESEVKKETSGDLRDLLVQLLAGKKDKESKVDQIKAEKDATTLYRVITFNVNIINYSKKKKKKKHTLNVHTFSFLYPTNLLSKS